MLVAGRSDLVVPLHAAADADVARVGTKAATLGKLVRAGLAVPDALVLTTQATSDVLRVAGVGADAPPEAVLGARLPDDVEAALEAIADHFADAVLAVRSSAAAEDLPGASFAGQYETVLHVRGVHQLRDATRRCWASAHAERVRAYQHGRTPRGGSVMAVLVQRQVDADVAGVAFTANPLSGARDEVLVSAVPGLGDSLVSGAQTPDEWVVAGSTATARHVTHQALAEPQARAVAALARRVEEVVGGPQDVEWAMADGRLVVLQARPITVLPKQPVVDLPPGTWVKEVEHYPEPFTALGASLAAPAVAEGLSAMFAAWGGVLERIETRAVAGEAYERAVPVGGRDGPPPPWWALALLARVAPALRRRMRTARSMMRPEVFEGLLDHWETVWQPELQAATATLRAVNLGGLDDRALDAHLGEAVEVLRRGLHVHFHLLPLYAVPPHHLVEACDQLLGWNEAEALTLLAGTSTISSEPTRALADLAGRISRHPGARAVVERGGAELAQQLSAADPELGGAFADWCDRYAYRCVHDDPGAPVFAERPALLASLLRDAMAAPADAEHGTEPARREATEAARAALAERAPADRRRFYRILSTALRFYPLREETAFSLAQAGGLVRLAAVEAGRRLSARGSVQRPEDAVQLDIETLRGALVGPPPADLWDRVAASRSERLWVSQHPGPPFHGPPPGPPPDVRGLPAPGRRLNAALLWTQPGRPQPSAADGSSTIGGVPGSPGVYTGPARLVCGEDDFPRLQRGDVLVCPTTDPAWSMLFGTAAALITDGGGVLSHAAIVAREHAIPAVIGTGTATRQLHDGDLVTVDGTTGLVTVEHPRRNPPGPRSINDLGAGHDRIANNGTS